MELLNQNPKYIIIDSVLTNYSMLMASKSQALDVKTIYKKNVKPTYYRFNCVGFTNLVKQQNQWH